MPTNVRDPRTIITPDAFGISPDLLGTPLARPGSRFWAMVIDLTVVGILTAMMEGRGLFVAGSGALFLIWVAFRSDRGRTSQAVSILLRVSTGCLGFGILGILLLVFLFSGLADDEGDEDGGAEIDLTLEQLEEAAEEAGGQAGGLAVARLIAGGLGSARRLARAEEAGEAEEAALRFLEGLEGLPLDREERLDILDELTPPDAPWADEADEVYRRALERWDASRAPAAPAGGADTAAVALAVDSAALAEEVEGLDDGEVLARYSDVLRADGPGADEPSRLRTRILRRRAFEVLAADTVSALAAEVMDLRADVAEAEERREEAERAMEEGNALVALLRDVWDQLGSAIGLWSIYFTVVLTLTRGQTVGKKLLGLRVLRLDGERMTWWSSFERAGGYVAGLATGLLGFAQVYWDPNRQCIHDKIVGTVVVDDRAERIPGSWREAWKEAPGVRSRAPESRERDGVGSRPGDPAGDAGGTPSSNPEEER